MGRHSNGRNNYSLSTGVIAAIVVAALLIAAVVWFGVARPTTSTESTAASCVAGDLEVPVSASDERVARELIDAYAATRPVVRDFCVTPTYSPDIAGAAVHIAPHNPVTHQQIAQAGRSAAEAEPRPVAATTVGLAGSEAASSDVSLSAVVFPVRQQSAASAVVAASLADDEAAAIAALTDQRVDSASDVASDPARFTATAEDAAPEGLVFTALDAAIVYAAIPLNQADPVSEDQARAGQDFARFAADRFNGDASTQPEISEMVWAAATPTGGENLTSDQPVAAAPAASVEDTLFVVDTSDAMAPYFAAVADAIGEAAYAVTDSGQSVALWNYSSPLNPGVARGYRRNIDMTGDASEVAQSVRLLGTGGQAQTREAVNAAVQYAAQRPELTRIVVVTTGTADAGDDAAFTADIDSVLNDSVEISVVHVGPGMEDPALAQLAQYHPLAVESADIGPALATATGVQQ